MGGYAPTLGSEDLAGILQDLPAGSHVAVTLRGIDLATALQVSQQAALERGDHLVVVGDRTRLAAGAAADSLGQALRLGDLAVDGRDTLLVVDAQASVRSGGAAEHAVAEGIVTLRPGLRLTVICFYTEDAIAAVTPAKVEGLHSMVAAPGQV